MEVSQKPNLDASWIDSRALEIVDRLQRAKHTTYLVGGCVRDLLLGFHPKDFDIATSAKPEEVRRAIPGSYLIGRRFRLILVRRGAQQFEVATFRRLAEASELNSNIEHQETNLFGTPEQDALRRDFTINALFYDPLEDRVIDFARGLEDLKAGWIRMIGNPEQRLREDPIRSLRAVRLAHKIGLQIEPEFRSAIAQLCELPAQSPLARRRLEYLKLFVLKDPGQAFLELWDLGLLKTLMPELAQRFEVESVREHFLDLLRTWKPASDSTVQLVLPWVWAWLQVEPGARDAINAWMQDEIGVFKSEQAEIWQAIELVPRIQNFSSFIKRGYRRQKSFLSQPQLEDALRLAQWDCLLSPQARAFWEMRLFALSAKKTFVSERNHRQPSSHLRANR